MKKSKQLKSTRKSKNPFHSARNLTLVAIFIIALVYLTISSMPRQAGAPIGINEVGLASSATVALTFPTTITSNIGKEASADIMIDSGGSNLTAVQVELTYDPSGITPLKIVQGDFLSNSLSDPKIQNGKITFTYVAALGEKGKMGSGKLATVVFKPLKDNTQLTFGKGTMVAAFGKSSNALAIATGTTIILAGSNITPPINPPVLEDIQPAPITAPATTPKQQTQTKTSNPSNNNPSSTGPIKAPSARTFDESDNFDYSKNTALTDFETQEITEDESTTFSRFLAFVKSIFGGNK